MRRLILFLVITLLAAGAIGWEAARAAAAERKTAEGVLRDYAGFAAWQFSRAASQQIAASIESTLSRAACAAAGGQMEAALRATPDETCQCGPTMLPVRGYFQRDSAGTWTAAGVVVPGALRAEIADAAGANLRTIEIDGRPSVVAWMQVHDQRTHGRVLRGYVADPAQLGRVLEAALARTPLLPQTLIDRARGAALLHVRVADPSNREWFASAGRASVFSADAQLAPAGSGLKARVSLAPEAASQLIIGGMPRSRLAWLYGLLALASLSFVFAVRQIRREAELGRLRANFIAGVSHELRTPLAQIRMFAETLLLGRVRTGAEARRSLEIVLREAQRLSQLADNVLCFQRGVRSAVTVTRRAVDVSAVLREAAESMQPIAEGRGAAIRIEAPAALEAEADPAALRQILLNLLDNAIKYGPAGQTVTASLSQTRQQVLVAIEDEGAGVPEGDRRLVWQAFWRGAGHAAGGSGIGLSIVRQLTGLHGGRTWVESAPGGGARFVVALPLSESPDAARSLVEGMGLRKPA
jgi:signal transduction histidine kinase